MMMDITDLHCILASFGDKDKQSRIKFIMESCSEGLISYDEADIQIEKIIREGKISPVK